MYTHFVRLHPANTDSNSHKVILFLWSSWQNYTQGADDVILNSETSKSNALFQDYIDPYNGSLRHVWDSANTTIIVYSKTLDEIKQERKGSLKLEYLSDVLWTDDTFLYYNKLVDLNINDASDDTWYSKIKSYWQESHNERETNKTDIANALNEAGVNAVTYTPTHVEPREDIE